MSERSVGRLILDALEQRGWTQTELAYVLDRPLQFVNEVCNDKKELTRVSAAQVAAALGETTDWWLRAQDAHRLERVKQTPLDAIRQRSAALAARPADRSTGTEGDR